MQTISVASKTSFYCAERHWIGDSMVPEADVTKYPSLSGGIGGCIILNQDFAIMPFRNSCFGIDSKCCFAILG